MGEAVDSAGVGQRAGRQGVGAFVEWFAGVAFDFANVNHNIPTQRRGAVGILALQRGEDVNFLNRLDASEAAFDLDRRRAALLDLL